MIHILSCTTRQKPMLHWDGIHKLSGRRAMIFRGVEKMTVSLRRQSFSFPVDTLLLLNSINRIHLKNRSQPSTLKPYFL